MIANQIAFGKSFSENILYNVQGNKAEPNPHKSEWYTSKNMFTDDLDAAGVMMQATASESKTPKPVYHFSIDWDRSEERFLTQEKCIEAADSILQKVGLEEHQALYFKHIDADHPHMHVVVNRVHPETGKAWDMWKSKERLERATHTVAKDMEFMQVPGRHNEMDFQPDLNKEAPSSRAEKSTEQDLKPWVKEKIPDIKAEIGNAFYHSNSWEELSEQMSEAGYELRQKGQGLIITDGEHYTQLSKMGKHVRLNSLEDKFGEKFNEHQGKDPLEPVTENSPDASLEDIPEKIERQLKQQIDTWEKQEVRNQTREAPATSDSRAIGLMNVLNNIEQFDGRWNMNESAANLLTKDKKIRRQEGYLKRAQSLLLHHKQKSYELIFKTYKEPKDDKRLNTEDKLAEAVKSMEKRKHKGPKLKRLLKVLKWRKKKLQIKKAKAKKHKKELKQKLKVKHADKLQGKIYYRMQKMQAAKSRVITQELELSKNQIDMYKNKRAHQHNVATRKHLASCRKELVKNIPKEAIMNASIPYKEKQRLFSAWFAEQEVKKIREKEKQRDRDIER